MRKKERQKINDVFLSIPPSGTLRENSNDEIAKVDNGHGIRRKQPPPVVRPLKKPNPSPSDCAGDDVDRKGQSVVLFLKMCDNISLVGICQFAICLLL